MSNQHTNLKNESKFNPVSLNLGLALTSRLDRFCNDKQLNRSDAVRLFLQNALLEYENSSNLFLIQTQNKG